LSRLGGGLAASSSHPGTSPKGEFAFFNVVYEDGSQRSNRRVPAELLGGLDGDEPAHGYILEQDRVIADSPSSSLERDFCRRRLFLVPYASATAADFSPPLILPAAFFKALATEP